jgi:hypothetical protein
LLLKPHARVEGLKLVQGERASAAVGVQVEQSEDEEDGGEARAVDGEHRRHLLDAHGGHDLARVRLDRRAEAHQGVDDERPDELERVDVEEDDEEQAGVHPDREVVVESVTAEELVLHEPDVEEHREGDGEGEEAAHRHQQLVEGLRHFERDDQQRDGEGDDRVRERLDARDLSQPAQAEAALHPDLSL